MRPVVATMLQRLSRCDSTDPAITTTSKGEKGTTVMTPRTHTSPAATVTTAAACRALLAMSVAV